MSKKILVIDDEASIRTLVQDLLEEQGYTVFTAADGKEGLHQAIKNKPNLVIVDFFMPESNGREFCEQLRTNTEIQDTKVIMLTVATFGEEGREELEELEILSYISKPFDNSKFLDEVKKILG